MTPQGAQAKETLSRIEKDTASAAFVKEALFHGKRALQRADGANAAGDADGAALLSRVALAHATNAEASLRAIAAEKKANEAQTKAKDLQDKLIRTRTLLADTQAQRGQVTAELVRADEDAKKASERSRSKEEERLKKGQTGDPKKSDAKKSDAKKSGAPKTDAKAGGSR